jgi:hypothetical protein
MIGAAKPTKGGATPLSRAWTCLLVNAFVCPGLGSLMGKRLSGLPQLVLAWGGGLWMIWMIVRYLHSSLQSLGVPPDWRYYWDSGRGGLCFFLAGWLWSVLTGLGLVRKARSAPPPAALE